MSKKVAMQKSGVDFSVILDELKAANLDPTVLRHPAGQLDIKGVVADSRKLAPGLAFCALRGSHHDGHSFLISSTNPSLGLAIIERADLATETLGGLAIIRVNSARAAWAQLASFFCNHPSKKISVIGITGTNGKTSTTWMVRSLLDAMSTPCASIGTLGIHTPWGQIETTHTTPDPDVLYPALAEFCERGIKVVVMEVSSHSLVQGKVWPIEFSGAGFTSFSQDHLDFHKDMDDYLDAKLLLFKNFLKIGSPAFFHVSLMSYEKVKGLVNKANNFKTYGPASLRPNVAVSSTMNRLLGTTRVQIESGEDRANLEIPMIGEVFAENFALAAILASDALRTPLARLADAVKNQGLAPVPGRLELVKIRELPWRPLVYVDYAHTPDALEKSILSLSSNTIKPAVVFGCGGDRDRSKRPLMGNIASRLASKVFITSDNPRTEDPQKILSDIAAGAGLDAANDSLLAQRIRVIPDRKSSIAQAVAELHGRDTLLIAGKGHENYQILGTKKLPFSDKDAAIAGLSTPRVWLVFGAGVSGFAAAEHLNRFGDKVLISDDRPIVLPGDLKNSATIIPPDKINWGDISAVVISPGVPPSHKICREAAQHGRPVISEIDLGLDGFPGKILAVTGTNGKSTTVAMTEFLGHELGLSLKACGNIGLPPTALNLRLSGHEDAIAIEISSYQLEGSQSWPSDAAAITSFSFDHLARHKTMDEYFRTKWLITQWLKPGAPLIISPDVAQFAVKIGATWPKARIIVVGTNASGLQLPVAFEAIDIKDGCCEIGGVRFDFSDFGILGLHNQCNAIFAGLMVQALSSRPLATFFQMLRQFPGLPFRCQGIFANQHLRVINDSKSTNLESTLSALTLAAKPAILLMGGQGKGESYAGLGVAKDKIHSLITFGASAHKIAADTSPFLLAEVFEKMQPAVLHALHKARDNKVDVLFSPGCASFDEFKNFEERGEIFNQLVRLEFKDFV
jgi:UDP-N-acetylmuramoylalanine--D-glutamate ligase